MAAKQLKKKRNWKKILTISVITISFLLSIIAILATSDIDEIKSGEDGESSLTRIDSLYGTHGCEEGGFSIQVGIDDNRNSVLESEEVDDIRNVCHGKQGESGPMGVRGYWGYNGSDGTNGTNGSIGQNGNSPFISAKTGEYGPCSRAAVIEMGNNSTSKVVESEIKICFENLSSGRLSDINQNTGNSFSTGCNGGLATDEIFVFAAVKDGNCKLYKLDSGEVQLLSPDVDFKPGNNLGFTEFRGRIWFDADDGSGLELWSVNESSIWKETNQSFSFDSDSKLIIVNQELVLSAIDEILIIGDSDVLIDVAHTNLTSDNGVLIFNTGDGLSINGSIHLGEIHSKAIYHGDYYWFFASTDNDGVELYRANENDLEKMTTTLSQFAGDNLGINLVNGHIVFDDSDIYSFNPNSLTLTVLNSTITEVSTDSEFTIFDDKIWFDCGIAGFGYELCVSDGVDAWLHIDYNPGMASSSPANFVVVKENLLLILDNPIEGSQLALVTDTGFEILWDHSISSHAGGVHGGMWSDSSSVYFIGDSDDYGLELYGWSHGEINDEWVVIY
ncbi:MAG: hypothetical protein CMB16_05615 [Euryarchaeota archaeon]|nr:hypothetical protein [Euryarchaeota archaeon]